MTMLDAIAAVIDPSAFEPIPDEAVSKITITAQVLRQHDARDTVVTLLKAISAMEFRTIEATPVGEPDATVAPLTDYRRIIEVLLANASEETPDDE